MTQTYGFRRILRVNDVAEMLNHSRPWFYANRKRLEQLGFPKKDPVLKGWPKISVDNWFDNRSGINTASNAENQMLEILNGKTNA